MSVEQITPLLPTVPEAIVSDVPSVDAARMQQRREQTYFVEVSPEYAIQSSVVEDVKRLSEAGCDVALTDPFDAHKLDPDTQLAVDKHIAELENAPNGHELFSAPPAMSRWMPLTKRAIALHPLYKAGTLETLGEGIDPGVYDMPMFSVGDDMKSAADILREEKAAKPEKAEQIIDDHRAFVVQPVDSESRLTYQGTMDGRAIRTRAYTTIDVVNEHFADIPSGARLTSASLACGAAGPVSELVKDMEEKRGVKFEDVILVDNDPLALASAAALTRTEGIDDKVRIERQDLLARPLTDYIESHSVDVVDLLGLFEYIPDGERVGHLATELLKRVKDIVKPGGVIVFGNMLDSRPQQKFFNDVVQWPRLYQRKIEDVLAIVERAGFDLSNTKVRIPAKEGVYAVYAISVPDSVDSPTAEQPYDADQAA